MRKWTLLLSVLFLLSRQYAEAQCNPAFNHSISGSGANFTAVVTAPQFYHFWTFGDGYTGSGSTTTHIYNLPGTYQVKHTIYDSLGICRDSTIQSVTLNFTPVCQASFYSFYDSVTYSYGIYCYSNSNPSEAQIRTFTWRVNNVVVGGNSSQLYFQPSQGTNTVCLTIESIAGCTSTYCQTFLVPLSCNLNPAFSYTANPANRKQISFTPSTNGSTLRYLWYFGDGYSSVDRQPVHTYNRAGNYLVRLSVWDTASYCVDTVRQEITIQSGPEDSCTASFTYTLNNYGLAQFTAQSNQPISSQFWSIYRYAGGDSAFINTSDPSYQFIDTGAYLVCLTLTTNNGCTRSYCEYIYVGNVQGRFAERIPAFPNPVTNGPVRFSLYIGRQEEIKVTVTDLYGNQVMQAKQTGYRGSNVISIPTDKFGKGQYFVEICVGYRLNRSIFQKL